MATGERRELITRPPCAARRAAALALLVASATAQAAPFVVDDFLAPGNGDWKPRSFAGDTEYRPVEIDGRRALCARAKASASALIREVDVDLDRTPYLRWTWKARILPQGSAAETSKAGDDYAARIYVVREGLLGRLTAHALNYVWSRRQPVDTRWPNAFTGRAILQAVDAGAPRGWVTHTRNVRADWDAAFGDRADTIDAVAIMTDADNTASEAAACYADIRFCATATCGETEDAPQSTGRSSAASDTTTPSSSQ